MTLPTLTLLHGFMGDPSDWDGVRTSLSDYPIVTPQIRPALNWEHGIQQLTDEIPSPSILVGYSMGARLLLGCALGRPEICQGLVFVSGNPGLEDEESRRRRRQADEDVAKRIETEPKEAFLQWWYTQSTVFRSLTDQLRDDEIKRKLTHRQDPWSETLRRYSLAHQPNYWPQLQHVRVPFLAVAGTLDRKYADIVLRMGRYRPIETRLVPACGHIVHREQPHVFLAILRNYLHQHFADA